MNFQIRCPNGHVLQIEEAHLGQQIRCPLCQIVMLVDAPAQPTVLPPPLPNNPVEVTDVEVVNESGVSRERDSRPRKKKDAVPKHQRMFLTRIGLTFHYAKILCFLASMLTLTFAVFLAFFAVQAPSQGAAVVSRIFAMLYFILFAMAPVLGVAGSLLCAWVPRKTGGKELIIISFALDAAGLVIYGGCQMISIAASMASGAKAAARTGPAAVMGNMAIAGSIGALLMMLVAWILFLMFLKAIFRYYEDDNMIEETQSLLHFSVSVVVGTPFYFAIGIILAAVIGFKTHLIVGGLIVVGLVVAWIIKVANMLLRLMAVISGARSYL
ncbi:MAG TPA: hypothetical protein VE988_12480 [Gemmataceae bacterium]|nr:hypothetical protein [Gemmataceae bacterium]